MTLTCRKLILALIAVSAGILLLPRCSAVITNANPEDSSGAYTTGVYRNLFLENGHSVEEIKAKLNAAFQYFAAHRWG